MSNLAQEEVDRLFSQRFTLSSHPEDVDNNASDYDRHHSDDLDSTYPINPPRNSKPQDSSDEDENNDHSKSRGRGRSNMATTTATTTTATCHLPTTIFDANTGPKGVIADAQSFDRAKKRSFRRTLLAFSPNTYLNKTANEKPALTKESDRSSSSERGGVSDDEEFMRQWRETRLMELQNGHRQRRSSPSKRRYGTFDDVDANGYLDAVERVPAETTVIVCIYDPHSHSSEQVEDSLLNLSRTYMSTRFIKLHHEIAEMDHVTAPAILAYKAGDVFATLVDIPHQVESEKGVNASSLEELMKRHDMLSR